MQMIERAHILPASTLFGIAPLTSSTFNRVSTSPSPQDLRHRDLVWWPKWWQGPRPYWSTTGRMVAVSPDEFGNLVVNQSGQSQVKTKWFEICLGEVNLGNAFVIYVFQKIYPNIFTIIVNEHASATLEKDWKEHDLMEWWNQLLIQNSCHVWVMRMWRMLPRKMTSWILNLKPKHLQLRPGKNCLTPKPPSTSSFQHPTKQPTVTNICNQRTKPIEPVPKQHSSRF